jgi:hypothetical protein
MRVKYLPVSAEFFVALQTRHGHQQRRLAVVDDRALPDDVRIVRVGHDSFGRLNLVLESSEWPEVEDGAEIEALPTPTMRVIWEPERG